MKRILVIAAAALVAAACAQKGERPSQPAGTPATTASTAATASTAPAATGQSQVPPPADAKAAAEIRKEIASFSLTEPMLDKIIATEGDLKGFWADPVEARKVRGERSLPKILAAIDASPRLKRTIEKHGLTPREYILGSFAMIGGYIWEKASTQQPQSVAGQQPPVNATTLATVKKRLDDVTKVLSPPPGRTKPPSRGKMPKGHPGDEE